MSATSPTPIFDQVLRDHPGVLEPSAPPLSSSPPPLPLGQVGPVLPRTSDGYVKDTTTEVEAQIAKARTRRRRRTAAGRRSV